MSIPDHPIYLGDSDEIPDFSDDDYVIPLLRPTPPSNHVDAVEEVFESPACAKLLQNTATNTKEEILQLYQAVSGATIHLQSSTTWLIKGTALQRQRLKKYVNVYGYLGGGKLLDWDVLGQESDPDDITLVKVPAEAIGMVCGKKLVNLRTWERLFVSIMYLIEYNESHFVVIYGPKRGRLPNQVNVWSAIEAKIKGSGHDKLMECEDTDGLGISLLTIKLTDVPFVIGKQGATKSKIQSASGCHLHIVANTVVCVGLPLQRERAQLYIHLLLATTAEESKSDNMMISHLAVPDIQHRTDVTIFPLPKPTQEGTTQSISRQSVARLESEHGCVVFTCTDYPNAAPEGVLIIFGPRLNRKRLLLSVIGITDGVTDKIFSSSLEQYVSREPSGHAWDTYLIKYNQTDAGILIGPSGKTKKKISHATQCAIEVVDSYGVFSGKGVARQNALLLFKMEKCLRADRQNFKAMMEIEHPHMQIQSIRVDKPLKQLFDKVSQIEAETSTMFFVDLSEKKVVVFGTSDVARTQALNTFTTYLQGIPTESPDPEKPAKSESKFYNNYGSESDSDRDKRPREDSRRRKESKRRRNHSEDHNRRNRDRDIRRQDSRDRKVSRERKKSVERNRSLDRKRRDQKPLENDRHRSRERAKDDGERHTKGHHKSKERRSRSRRRDKEKDRRRREASHSRDKDLKRRR